MVALNGLFEARDCGYGYAYVAFDELSHRGTSFVFKVIPCGIAHICLTTCITVCFLQRCELLVLCRVKNHQNWSCAGREAVRGERQFLCEATLSASRNGHAELQLVGQRNAGRCIVFPAVDLPSLGRVTGSLDNRLFS